MIQEREKKRKLRIRAALGMNAEGIDVTEAESAFSLSELGMSKSKVDAIENAGADSSDDDDSSEDDESDAESVDSEEEYEELLESQMDKLYDDFLTRRGDDVKTKKAVKRSKIAKRALAGEALVQDSEMYDGDAQAYRQMINPDEVCSVHVCACCMSASRSPHSCYLFRVARYSAQLSNMGESNTIGNAIMSDRVGLRFGVKPMQSFVHPTSLPSLQILTVYVALIAEFGR